MAEATLIGVDTVASGDWIGKRGRAGWSLYPDSGQALVQLPTTWMGSCDVISGSYLWSVPNDLPTLPQLPSGGRTRRAYNSVAPILVQPRPVGNAPYLLSLYMTEPTNHGRVQTVTARTTGGAVLASAEVGQPTFFTNGAWVVFACRGDVNFEVKQTVGNNAVVFAVVFDPWPQGFVGLSQGFVGHGVF